MLLSRIYWNIYVFPPNLIFVNSFFSANQFLIQILSCAALWKTNATAHNILRRATPQCMWLYLYDCTVFYTLTASVVCKDTKQDYGSKQSTPGSVVPLAMFHLVHSPTWIHRRSNLLCLESMLERWKGQKIIWKHLFLESHLKWWSYCMVSASLLFGNVCVLVLQTFDIIGVFCFSATIWKYICPLHFVF